MPTGLDAHLVVRRGADFTLDLPLTIRAGQTVALLGPNGGGKSTAVHTLAGLTPLDGGRIVLDGRTLDDPAREAFVPPEGRRIGVVFQDYALFPHLTVAENVAFGVLSRAHGRRRARDRAAAWLRSFGLGELADRSPGDLSGGQAQQVALARALITEPDLLLLDEPLAALDVSTRVQLRRSLRTHLDAFAGPRLLITHEPTEAFLLADRIHVVEGGAVTQVGTAEEIRLRPRTAYVADLAGSNLLLGTLHRGTVTTATRELHVADTHTEGPVLVTIHPRAIAIHRHRPEGSPRNTWQTHVALVENLGERVRLNLGDPLPLTAEITPEAIRALALSEETPVWVSVKATEIGVETA